MENNSKIYKINAQGKKIGRLATEVSHILRGKNMPNYSPEKFPNITVLISNIISLNISDKKLATNKFVSHTGYPGSINEKSWQTIYNNNPRKLFLLIIKNMLPRNKMRLKLLKNIKFD